jgi:uncharacterized membrane protein YkvA (DUF1232 family)
MIGSKQRTTHGTGSGRASGRGPIGAWENLRLTWRMLRDPRVAPYAKVLLPVLALVYLISPIDFIPDMILGLGQVDDLGVIALLGYLLITYVRRAGWATLIEKGPVASARRESPKNANSYTESSDIIDAQYRIISRPRHRREPGATK